MDRPTRDEFDEAYGHAETLSEMIADGSRTEQSILPSEMNLLTLAAEVRALREELAAERKDRREPGCVCTWEVGDSPCPVHPLNPNTELPYTAREAADLEAENARLRAELDALKASVAAGT